MNANALLIASLASALAVPGVALVTHETAQDKSEAIHCYGVNKCKGVGDCGGKGHSCAGQNSCKGQGYLDMSKDLCLKIEGGRLTENTESTQPTDTTKPSKKS